MSLNVEGQNCPVCKGHLFNDDDIVYCPVCGAPHHRDCYNALGHCAYEELHGTDKQYKKPEDAPAEVHGETVENNHFRTCPNCGEKNNSGSLYCNQCGQRMSSGENESEKTGNSFGGGTANPFVIDPLGGVGQDELIDGIPAMDVARFVVFNTTRYIPKFKSISKQKKASWNWAAFLFPEGWLFYRKCYKQGFIFLMISLIASVLIIPTQIFANGIVPPDAATTGDVMNAIFQNMGSYTPFMQLTAALSWAINIGYRIVCGIFGDYIYKRHAISRVTELKKQSGYSEILPRAGGVNLIMLLVAFAATSWLPMLITMFI